MNSNKKLLVLIFAFVIFIYILIVNNKNDVGNDLVVEKAHSNKERFEYEREEIKIKKIKETSIKEEINYDIVQARDFMSYKCKNRKRIGGYDFIVKQIQDPLYRIEGSWFLCLDKSLNLEVDSCNVLSFGISHDFSFDKYLNDNYGCVIHSFDPFAETGFFGNIRANSSSLKESPTLGVNSKWKFHRIGIDANSQKSHSNVKINSLLSYTEILKYIELEDKVIDVLKMDVEGAEFDFIESLDMDYACEFIKQFVLETHPIHATQYRSRSPDHLKTLRKLEKCFLIYHRDTRFFMGDVNSGLGPLTEFQNPKGYSLDLKLFKSEINLANFMFTYGELYFVNKKFL